MVHPQCHVSRQSILVEPNCRPRRSNVSDKSSERREATDGLVRDDSLALVVVCDISSSCVLLRCRRDNEMNDGPVRQWRAGLVCDLNDLCIEPVTKIKGGWADCQPVHDLGFSPKVRISEPQARCRSRLQSNPCHLRFIDCPMFHRRSARCLCTIFRENSYPTPMDFIEKPTAFTRLHLSRCLADESRQQCVDESRVRCGALRRSTCHPDQDCRNANAACRIILRSWLATRCCDDEHSVNPAKRVRNRAEDLAQYSVERLS
ncbi:hypothetical protein K456DRAFT_1083928 [Colletotrichum gloeosporioides 23]|nr:hypothetical protein K456DRAFT_1083928 [Colletotrichum gloeosporioides 23]